MKCIDCSYLSKAKNDEFEGYVDLYCKKYNVHHVPISENTLKYLNCVENERKQDE